MITTVGLIIVSGLIFSKLAHLAKLPSVTGYLVGGVIIGPAILHIISEADLSQLEIVSEIALAFIAFGIGSEFSLKHLRKVGKNIVILTLTQALGAMILVFGIMYMFSHDFSFSLLLGAISAATAPAAIVMVVKQYKVDGPLVRTLLPIVAIDDAVCIILFGISVSIAKVTLTGAHMSVLHMIEEPMIEIVSSLALGLAAGLIYSIVHKKLRSPEEMMITVVAMVFLSMGVAMRFHLSTLLACMMLGATIVNTVHDCRKVFALVDNITPPIYLMFFTLAGASLHLGELSHMGLLGVAYILARAAGKMIGSAIGAHATHSPEVISKYLGISLLPQAGVAVGLASLVKTNFPMYSSTLTTLVLGGVVVFAFIGPMLVKLSFTKANEIGVAS